jgi:hypothetical protein
VHGHVHGENVACSFEAKSMWIALASIVHIGKAARTNLIPDIYNRTIEDPYRKRVDGEDYDLECFIKVILHKGL